MPGTWPRPSSAISRSSPPSICPSIDPSSTPSFTSSQPSPPTRSTRSSPSSIFSPAISSKQQPEKPLIRVTYHHCHPTAEDLSRRVAAFEDRLNQDPCAVADRLWVKDHLDPDEEKLRFSK